MTPDEEIQKLISKGWRIISDGPSGIQIEKPKAMKGLDQLCMIGGVLALFFILPLGLIMIGIAIIDYAFLTKAESKFISRTPVERPPSIFPEPTPAAPSVNWVKVGK